MQKAKVVLTKLNQKSKKKKEVKTYRSRRIYRNLFNPDFYLNAYAKIYHKEGNMTEGVDGKSIDGFNMETINSIIEKIRHERYYPKPVRRVYIPKKNKNEKRPIGIPPFEDKLVQEVIRQILEAIYEPHFLNTSHGFRPGRSCQTALYDIKSRCTGSTWCIEGDIKSFFDTIDHEILLNTLRKKIDDGRIIELIRRFLKAGYMEDLKYFDSKRGAPQGGLISPILANIYLHEFDEFIRELSEEYSKGKKRANNPQYTSLTKKRGKSLKEGDYKKAKEYLKEMRKIPSTNKMDPNFIRVKYTRYADDFVVFIIGSKKLAEEIKEKMASFLKDKLKLTLNMDKTFITNITKRKVKFLNYEIKIAKDNSRLTKDSERGFKRRSINGVVQLLVPMSVINEKIKPYQKKGKPIHFGPIVNLPLLDILIRFNSTIRGLYNYYSLANNVGKRLNKFKYYHYTSLLKTVACKLRSSTSKVLKKYGIPVKRKAGTGTRNIFSIKYKTKKGEKTLTYFNESLGRVIKPLPYTPKTSGIYLGSNCQLIKRLNANKCELCGVEGTPDIFEVHHVRKLKDVKRKWRKRGKKVPVWILTMSKMNRKTLVVCKQCHKAIHNGNWSSGE